MVDIYDNAIIDYNAINNIITSIKSQSTKVSEIVKIARISSDNLGTSQPTDLSNLKIVTAKSTFKSDGSATFRLPGFTSQPIVNVTLVSPSKPPLMTCSVVFDSQATNVGTFTVYLLGIADSSRIAATVAHVIAIGS